MRQVIFYSWQSDLPNAANRGFIQQALENAAGAIAADGSVAVEPVVDRDTQGVAGAPDIASTIFAKIDAADVVVADVSITSRPDQGRPTPNPNVLIELGYALKALGHERIILVFNTAFGRIEELPFDLRTRRVATYDMPAVGKQRAPVRGELERTFDAAIRAALDRVPVQVEAAASSSAVAAIETRQANRIVTVRRALAEILVRLNEKEPPKFSADGTVEKLLAAIEGTQEVVGAFCKIAEVIAIMDDVDAALEVTRWFGNMFEKYNLPERYSGQYSNADFDYFKFVGHELFVSLVACLLRERRWSLIQRVLEEPIPMRYKANEHGPGAAEWAYASNHLVSLIDESRRRNRISLHGDILLARHTTGALSGVLPFDEFAAADFLLFLRGEVGSEAASDWFMAWRPWSSLALKHMPMFLVSAQRKEEAERIAKILGAPDAATFKTRLKERAVPRLARLFSGGFWDPPFNDEEIDKIGSR